jgi:hypothetical protein
MRFFDVGARLLAISGSGKSIASDLKWIEPAIARDNSMSRMFAMVANASRLSTLRSRCGALTNDAA